MSKPRKANQEGKVSAKSKTAANGDWQLANGEWRVVFLEGSAPAPPSSFNS